MDTLQSYIDSYQNTGANNDKVHLEFTENTNKLALLKNHRDYVEKNKLGFGDRAFQYMWYLLLEDLHKKLPIVRMLEIGVFKGQVISLWSLLTKEFNRQAEIAAITPLEGNVPKNKLLNNRFINKIKLLVSPAYRKCVADGNNYLIEDYAIIIRRLFEHFGLSYDAVKIYKGYSNDPAILSAVAGQKFDLIYIDGDHSYEGAQQDIRHYSDLINKGGYMVMDDASWFLEGSVFWKGHKEVSRACEIIEGLEFRNVLNVGHNRIYEKY